MSRRPRRLVFQENTNHFRVTGHAGQIEGSLSVDIPLVDVEGQVALVRLEGDAGGSKVRLTDALEKQEGERNISFNLLAYTHTSNKLRDQFKKSDYNDH